MSKNFGVSTSEVKRIRNKVQKDIKFKGNDPFKFKSVATRSSWYPKKIKFGT